MTSWPRTEDRSVSCLEGGQSEEAEEVRQVVRKVRHRNLEGYRHRGVLEGDRSQLPGEGGGSLEDGAGAGGQGQQGGRAPGECVECGVHFV